MNPSILCALKTGQFVKALEAHSPGLLADFLAIARGFSDSAPATFEGALALLRPNARKQRQAEQSARDDLMDRAFTRLKELADAPVGPPGATEAVNAVFRELAADSIHHAEMAASVARFELANKTLQVSVKLAEDGIDGRPSITSVLDGLAKSRERAQMRESKRTQVIVVE